MCECQETLRAISRLRNGQSVADTAASQVIISSTSPCIQSPAAVTSSPPAGGRISVSGKSPISTSEDSDAGYNACLVANRGLETGTKLPPSKRASSLFSQLQQRIVTNNKT